MAQYLWDANDYAENTVPADFGWTMQAGAPTVSRIEGAAGSRYWRENKSSDSTRNYSFNAVPASDNIETLCDMEIGVVSSSTAGRWNSILNMNFPPHGYRFGGNGHTTTSPHHRTAIFEFSGGSFVTHRPSSANWYVNLPLTPTRVMAKSYRNGGTVRFKIWVKGDAEPGWIQDGDNGGITGNVLVGWGGYYGLETKLYSFAVGTDGDPAPTEPVVADRRRSPLLLTPW